MTVSIVVPMFRTRRFVRPLLERLRAVVPGAEVLVVDDACPERSGDAALEIDAAGLDIAVVGLSRNIGQHAAVLVGLRAATGDVVVVMDGDLQDAPEDVPTLVAALASDPAAGAVCAARAGRYAAATQRLTARAYRRTATLLSGGRVPRRAGMFLAARRHAVDAVLELDDPFVPLVPALAASGICVRAIDIERAPRDDASTAHTSRLRVSIALRGLVALTPARPVLAALHRRRWRRIAPVISSRSIDRSRTRD